MARASWLTLVVLSMAVVIGGCDGGAVFARRSTVPAPALRADGQATVVLMRPGRWPSSIRLQVADGSGTLLADLGTGEWSVARMAPGPIELVMRRGWADPMFNGPLSHGFPDRIEGVLAPGRVYFVYVGASYGGGRFEVMRPGHEQWETREELLTAMPRVEVDDAAATEYFDRRHHERAQIIGNGRERWSALDDAQRAERTIGPADGI